MADNGDIASDPRFRHVLTDPRFKVRGHNITYPRPDLFVSPGHSTAFSQSANWIPVPVHVH